MLRHESGRGVVLRLGLLVALACLAAPAALAQDRPPGPPPVGPGFGGGPDMHAPPRPHDGGGPLGRALGGPLGGPLGGLAKAEADNAAAETIAGIAGAPVAEVRRIVRAWDVPTALRYYDVDPQAFQAANTPKLLALVDEAAKDQAISASDAARLSARLRQKPAAPPPPPSPPE